MTSAPRVAILQPLIADYRVSFYTKLTEELSASGIGLDVYASPSPAGSSYVDGMADIPCGTSIRARRCAGIYWQGWGAPLHAADLAILVDEVRAATNYAVLLSRILARRPRRVAFWGHGRNFQETDSAAISDFMRRITIRLADRYFAYTTLSREAFVERGAPADRVTVVNNSKDTSAIDGIRATLSSENRGQLRAAEGLDAETPVAVFCSRLHPGKQVPFLIDASRRVRETIPDFRLLIVGGGELENWLRAEIADEPWIRWVGPKYGPDLAKLLLAADIFVMPAHVGLSIVDAFAAGLPVVAADFPNHSPEIAYLESGVNGLMAPATTEGYADAVVRLLGDKSGLDAMRDAALQSARQYSLDAMVANFADGVREAIAQ